MCGEVLGFEQVEGIGQSVGGRLSPGGDGGGGQHEERARDPKLRHFRPPASEGGARARTIYPEFSRLGRVEDRISPTAVKDIHWVRPRRWTPGWNERLDVPARTRILFLTIALLAAAL